MEDTNGDKKIIFFRLDKLEECVEKNFTEFHHKLDMIVTANSRQDLDINKIGEKIRSCQVELTSHKDDHKYNTGIIITIASMIGGFVAWLISYFKGR